jgi:FKBP-type peptidyl-prolyl cis-trans isomerase 2
MDRVTEVSDSTVTLDANHVLAGGDVMFRLELVEIALPAPHQAGEAAVGKRGAES